MTRKLDALVAERLFNWQWQELDGDICLMGPTNSDITPVYWPNRSQHVYPVDNPWGMPGYSSDIAAAWLLAENMSLEHYDFAVVSIGRGSRWQVSWGTGPWDEIEAPTVPLAIVIAALRAVGVSEDEIQEAMRE